MALKNQSRRVAAAARDAGAEAVREGEERFDEFKDALQDRVKQARKVAEQKAKLVQEYAEENPWRMTGLGVVAGFILGALIFRRRD